MIPRSKEAIQDLVIAAILIVLGILAPGSVIDQGFDKHVSGLAIGIGIGWIIKSIISHAKGKQ